jgi:endonuclease YncB( thermonuclease family)
MLNFRGIRSQSRCSEGGALMRHVTLLVGALLLVGCAGSTASPSARPSAVAVSPSPSGVVELSPSAEPLPSASRDPILISPETFWDGTQVIDGPISIEGYVVSITDGDTFDMCISRGYSCELTDETITVRLVQIDTPEDGDVKECYGATASLELADLLVEGAPVIAVTDPNLDQEDAYGRMLAWVPQRRTSTRVHVAHFLSVLSLRLLLHELRGADYGVRALARRMHQRRGSQRAQPTNGVR